MTGVGALRKAIGKGKQDMAEIQLKVLMVNAGPHKRGCTNRALEEIASELERQNVGSTIFWVGTKPIASCISCHRCAELGRCVFDDRVNDFVDIALHYDGIVLGSPVHYGAATGAATAFFDRAFYTLSRAGGPDALRMKVGAAVASCRRAGNTATIDQLNRYFQLLQMPIATGRYWNIVHGYTPYDVEQDAEGLQNLRYLARNMAFLMKTVAAAPQMGIELSAQEPAVYTNFIR